MDITLRRGTREDAESCGRICHEAFATIAQQHNFPPDMPNTEVAIGLLAMLLDHPGLATKPGARHPATSRGVTRSAALSMVMTGQGSSPTP